jgi:serine/threonine protein kinase
VGSYVLDEAFALGQTGTLFLGHQTDDGPRLLLKVLSHVDAAVDARRALLESVGSLELPGVQPIRAVVEHDGRLVVAKLFQPGRTLAAHLFAQGPLSAGETVALGRRLCRTLHHIHQSGLAHHDVRPGHLFIAEGGTPTDALLMDLGLPSPAGPLAAPEMGEEQTDATAIDVYGVCATMAFALVSPVGEASVHTTPSAQELLHQLPEPDSFLAQLLRWGLAEDPWNRPPVSELTMILDAMAEGNDKRVARALSRAEGYVVPPPAASPPPGPPPSSEQEGGVTATLRLVKKALSRGRETGLTQPFFAAGDRLEKEFAEMEREEALAQRELKAARGRLLALVGTAVVLGVSVLWALWQ